MEAQQQELRLLIGQKEKQTEQLERLKIIEVVNNNLKQSICSFCMNIIKIICKF